ncbi:MAG: ABC transporter ATP-binding protein [Candidatus Omnitrophica bacterium]|nr:ABC transporter ATP-binding protein [Candidatus Omnitrophota bacterium]
MIEIINLTKSFSGRKVLDNLNLTIRTGETMVIIGGSGCGKSVLLKHMMGILKPESGQVMIDNQDIARLQGERLDEIRVKFGMLFQGAALFDSLTVFENVAFTALEHGMHDEAKVHAKVREKLALVGLRGIERMKPAELSGGMRKRVGLARALFTDPETVLYDEPTTGLDPIMADVINDLIIQMHERFSVTSVAVTHDMTSAYKIADRIAMLYEGKIIEVGTPDEIKKTSNPVVAQFIRGEAEGPITRTSRLRDMQDHHEEAPYERADRA